MFIMNETIAMNVLGVVDQGLSEGLGKPIPGQMCVEAAVCYALGLPHSDDPGCVSKAVRSLKIQLNDSNWSSNDARAKGMRRLAIAQLGTKDNLDEKEFAKRVAEMTIRKIVPIALRATGIADLEVHAVHCETEGSSEAARAAASAADSARYADAAVDYAAYSARDAAEVARDAADAYAYAAARDAYAADKDSVLSMFAEEVVKILVDMKSPGSEYLYLTE